MTKSFPKFDPVFCSDVTLRMTDSLLSLGDDVTNSSLHGNNSLFSHVSTTEASGISSSNSFTFGEIKDLFDNGTIYGQMFNSTEMPMAQRPETTYNCQLYRFIMSVRTDRKSVYLWNCG